MELRENQKAILKYIRELPYSLIVHYMRAGKTLPPCLYIKEMKGKALILCPPKAIPVWEKHLRMVKCPKKKYTIISHGILHELKSTKEDSKYDLLIIDELHHFRNYSGRTQFVLSLSKKIKKVVGLTATPIENDLQNIFYELQILDKGELFGTNKNEFQKEFCDCINPHSDYPKFMFKPHLVEPVMETLSKFTTVYRPPEITPPSEFVWRFRLHKEHEEILQKVVERTPIEEIGKANMKWEKGIITRKRLQIASGFLLYDDKEEQEKYSWVFDRPSRKRDHLDGLLNSFEDQQAVIWYNFVEERRLIIPWDRGGGYQFREFSTENLKAFKKGKFQFLVCHPRSAGEGVDISFCHNAVYLSHPFSMIEYEQSLYRLSSFRAKEEKFVHHLIPDHPFYEGLFYKLKLKKKSLNDFYKKGIL